MPATALDTLITFNPWTLSPATAVAEAARLLDETGVHHWPLVDDDGALVGTLGAAALAGALERDRSGGTRIELIADMQPVSVTLDACPLETLAAMLRSGKRMLPVTDAGRVIGALSTTDYLRELSYGGARVATEPIVDFVEKSGEPIDSDASLEQVQTLLNEAEFLVVVQGDFPLAAITRTNLAIARVQQFARSARGAANAVRTIGQLLQTAPTIPPGRSLGEAAALLVEHQLDALAVTSQAAHLSGVLTEETLLRAMLGK
jgi:CBS domain-containing protein